MVVDVDVVVIVDVVVDVIGDVDDTFCDGDGDAMDVDRRGAKDDRRHADRGRP